ncbi:hypothetical protein [Rhodoligotrophos defluvii]|nr:hypothetical protein [Rhodoligotrophos defluvii]
MMRIKDRDRDEERFFKRIEATVVLLAIASFGAVTVLAVVF